MSYSKGANCGGGVGGGDGGAGGECSYDSRERRWCLSRDWQSLLETLVAFVQALYGKVSYSVLLLLVSL